MSDAPHDAPTASVNPYAAPLSDARLVLVDPQPYRVASRRRTTALGLAAATITGTIPAAAVATWDVESIVFSGPIVAFAATALWILSFKPPLQALTGIALASLLFVLGCFLAINLMEWSPAEAQKPIATACVVFAAISQAGWALVRMVYRGASVDATAEPPGTSSAPMVEPPMPYAHSTRD